MGLPSLFHTCRASGLYSIIVRYATPHTKEARLNSNIVHDIDKLDIGLYKEILEMEDEVQKTMSG